jgi:hypothetical protein
MVSTRRRQFFAAAALVAALGCSAFVTAGAGSVTAAAAAGVGEAQFDPARFGNPATGASKWQPLRPGYQSVRRGGVSRGSRRLPHIRVFTVTAVTKVIAGVRAVAVLDQDFDGGQLAEQALDYMAEDKQGNVWYLGSYTESYEGGQFVNAEDGWLAGVRGAKAGIFVQAQPRVGTASFYQFQVPGLESPTARVAKTGQSVCVPFKCYKGVLVVEEDGSEYKYYAPGVGGIRTEPRYSGGEQETENLVNLRLLGARGLAELSAEALKLDKHARVTVPDVFGRSAAAKRTL